MSTFQVYLAGQPVAIDFYDRLIALEVEENADMPGALQLRLPVATTSDGDLTSVNDAGLQPLASVAVVATADGGSDEVIFDGYVLGHKLHLESGMRESTLEVYGQDASWLMNLEEKTREWSDTTEGTAANTIFGDYGFTPGSSNLDDDSGQWSSDAHSLMQRGTDYFFLKTLAQRSGRLFRVIGGAAPGTPQGLFAKPDTSAGPVATLSPNDPVAPNVRKLDFEWDVLRPNSALAQQALFSDDSGDPAVGDATDPDLDALGDRDLATFTGKTASVRLTAPVDDAGQLTRRATALLRDAAWFVRCTGEADLSALHVVLRAGSILSIEGVGSVHSGKYLIWTVRHILTQQSHKMQFTLVRNAVGPVPSATSGLAATIGGL